MCYAVKIILIIANDYSYRCDEGCVGNSLGAMGVFVFGTIMSGVRAISFGDAMLASFIRSCASLALNLMPLHSSGFITLVSSAFFSARDTVDGQSSSTLSSERI